MLQNSVLGSNIDIVDEFLSQLDTYDPETCKPGTEASLGEGVVQQYGTSRFRYTELEQENLLDSNLLIS